MDRGVAFAGSAQQYVFLRFMQISIQHVSWIEIDGQRQGLSSGVLTALTPSGGP
jgi:hypothetical protein